MSAEITRLFERIEEHGARVTLQNGKLLIEQENKLPPNLAFKVQAKEKEILKYIHSIHPTHPINSVHSVHLAVMGRKSERGEWGSERPFTPRSPSKPLQNKLFSPIGEQSERGEGALRGYAKTAQNSTVLGLESERLRVNVHSEAIHPHSPRPCRFFVCPVCGERAASKDYEAVDCTCGQPMRLTEVEPAP